MISSGPAVTTESRSASFVFAADGRDLVYECALDGGAVLALRLAEDLQRRADRPAHLRGPGSWSPTRQAEPESTTYDLDGRREPRRRRPRSSGARVTRASPPIPRAPAPTATFAFESNEAPVTFECALDGAAFTACPDSGRVHRPDAGTAPAPRPCRRPGPERRRHARDAGAGRSCSIDPADDDDRQRERHRRVEGVHTAIFTFTANEPLATTTFECQIDAEPFEQCESPDGVLRPDPGQPPVPRPRDRPGAERRADRRSPTTSPSGSTTRRPRRRSSPARRPSVPRRLGQLRRSSPATPTRPSSARSTPSRSRSASSPPSSSSSSRASTRSGSARSTCS